MSAALPLSACLFPVLLAIAPLAAAVTLVTPAEALLPKAPLEETKAGLTRGPGIELEAPAGTTPVRSPVRIALRFKAYGGTTIEQEQVTITYLSQPSIDLTSRIKSYISAAGLLIPGASIPPGTHHLQVQVADSKGRLNKKIVVLKVVD